MIEKFVRPEFSLAVSPLLSILTILFCHDLLFCDDCVWEMGQTAAIVSVQPHVTSASLFSFFDYLWQNQPSFSQAAFYGKTQADLYSLMASYASHWGVTNSTFYGLMGSDQIFNIAYNGVQMGADRHVHSTPTFYINGLHSTFDENTTYDQWVAFINQLL